MKLVLSITRVFWIVFSLLIFTTIGWSTCSMIVGPGSTVNEYCGLRPARCCPQPSEHERSNLLNIKEASMCFQWLWMVDNLSWPLIILCFPASKSLIFPSLFFYMFCLHSHDICVAARDWHLSRSCWHKCGSLRNELWWIFFLCTTFCWICSSFHHAMDYDFIIFFCWNVMDLSRGSSAQLSTGTAVDNIGFDVFFTSSMDVKNGV